MAHHAYYLVSEQEAGVAKALSFAQETLGMSLENNPDIIVLRHGLFSVDDARRVIRHAGQTGVRGEKLIVITAERIFHEAQNALLKIFEEPPEGTTLILIIPSGGLLLATLRSRLLSLPGTSSEHTTPEAVVAFIRATPSEREKSVAKLLDRSKSDKDDEKQAVRGEALRLIEGLTEVAHRQWSKKPDVELTLFLEDMNRFIPILHERSAPLKLIFEHLLITFPKSLVV